MEEEGHQQQSTTLPTPQQAMWLSRQGRCHDYYDYFRGHCFCRFYQLRRLPPLVP